LARERQRRHWESGSNDTNAARRRIRRVRAALMLLYDINAGRARESRRVLRSRTRARAHQSPQFVPTRLTSLAGVAALTILVRSIARLEWVRLDYG
jgi:hypothetical protein